MPDEKRRYKGHVAIYNRERGFGFIQSEAFQEPLWFHYTFIDGEDANELYEALNTRADLQTIKVSFETSQQDLRGPQARAIHRLSDFPELEELLKFSNPKDRELIDKFSELATIPALLHVEQSSSLTRYVVSKIVRSAKSWEDLTKLARQWAEALSIFEIPAKFQHENYRLLIDLIQSVTNALRFEVRQDPELLPLVPAVVQPLAKPLSPLRCFRECDEVSLVVLQSAAMVTHMLKTSPSFVGSTKLHIKLLILLDSDDASTDFVQKAGGTDIIIIRPETIIRLILSSDEDYPVLLGRRLRATLPLHRLQPYEVGREYSESVFAGRALERRRILDNPESNHAVYGGRKIGKTWFLKDIVHWCEKEPYSSMYQPFYVSLQSAESVEDAVSMIQDKITDQLDISSSLARDTVFGMSNILRKAHKLTGKTVLLALDEIDDVLKSAHYYVLFARLRQLQQTYPGAFKYIFAGFKELIHAFSDVASNNPFANWIGKNHFPLGCLTEADLQSLIVTPLRCVGLDFKSAEIVQAIFALTSGHPYYTQSLCHSLVSARLGQNSSNLSAQHIERLATEEFLDEVFDIFVANLSPLQMLIGKVFAEREGVFSDDDIIQALHDRFGLEITKRDLREEMKILQACSVFARQEGGYHPVLQRINHEFFSRQDDISLALLHLEGRRGI